MPKTRPNPQKTVTLHPDVLASIDKMAEFLREKPGVTIQRACIEYLERNGEWPPKKEAK